MGLEQKHLERAMLTYETVRRTPYDNNDDEDEDIQVTLI